MNTEPYALSSSAHHRAVTLRELADEVDALELLMVRARAVSKALELLVKVRARGGFRQINEKVQCKLKPVLGDRVREPRREKGNVLLNLPFDVCRREGDRGCENKHAKHRSSSTLTHTPTRSATCS